jgi:hypothetical protein
VQFPRRVRLSAVRLAEDLHRSRTITGGRDQRLRHAGFSVADNQRFVNGEAVYRLDAGAKNGRRRRQHHLDITGRR